MPWEKITDIILISAIAVLGVFALLGLFEWISRKSLKKVDHEITGFILPSLFMAATYVIFDKFLALNTRPNGSGEPSFPSTHTMVVATIFLCTIFALPKYVKNKPLRIILDILMLALIGLVSAGRVLSNMHWLSDVIGGLVFAVFFATIYYLIIKKHHKKETK